MAKVDRTISKAGYQLIIASGSVQKKVKSALTSGLSATGKDFLKQVKKNISLDDHTLAKLRRLGHPYAVDTGASPVHEDDRLVHIQEGDLKRSIKLSSVQEESSRRFGVYVTSDDEAMPYLIFGTVKMRPRRFHEKSYEEIRGTLWNPIKDRLAKLVHRIEVYAKTHGYQQRG